MTPSCACLARDHPRSRGEHMPAPEGIDVDDGSSPLARGARLYFQSRTRYTRIIPARAGSTIHTAMVVMPKQDHPRSRGEHAALPIIRVVHVGSSPLARGAPDTRRCYVGRRGVRDDLLPRLGRRRSTNHRQARRGGRRRGAWRRHRRARRTRPQRRCVMVEYPYADDIPEMTVKATHVFGSDDTPAAQFAPGVFVDANGVTWPWWRFEFRPQPSDLVITVPRDEIWSVWHVLGPAMPGD